MAVSVRTGGPADAVQNVVDANDACRRAVGNRWRAAVVRRIGGRSEGTAGADVCVVVRNV